MTLIALVPNWLSSLGVRSADDTVHSYGRKMVFTVLAVAELERSLIVERWRNRRFTLFHTNQ